MVQPARWTNISQPLYGADMVLVSAYPGVGIDYPFDNQVLISEDDGSRFICSPDPMQAVLDCLTQGSKF